MSAYIILPVVAFFINIITMSYIAAIDYRKPVVRAYLLFTGVFTLWMLMGWVYYFPVSDGLKMPLCKYSSPTWFFTGFAFYHFTLTFLERKKDAAYFVMLAAACVSVGITISTGLVVSGHRYYPWGWRFTEGPLFNAVTLATIIIPVLWSWVLLFRIWLQSREPTRRTQIGIMVSGVLFALIAAVIMQYLLPRVFGMDTTVRYNSQASIILSFFIFYAIIRYRFLSPGVSDVAADLFSTIGEGLVLMSIEGKVLQMNPAAVKILCLDGADAGTVSLPSVIENYDATATYNAHQTTVCSPGERKQVLLNQSEIKVHGSAGGRVLIINDISGVVRLDAAVRESEAVLSMIAENVSDLIWIMDLHSFSFSYVSPSVLNIFGWNPEEFMALPLDRQLHKDSLEMALAVLNEELLHDAERDPFRNRELELLEFRADGKFVEVEIKVTFIRNKDGAPTGLLGVTRDITRRKKLERELEDSLGQLRERTKSLEKDLMTAHTIQRALLPDAPPACPGFNIGFKYLPLEAVGGDYFSIVPLEEGGLAVFLGDVAGHGVPAALFLSLLKSESGRLLREFAFDPARYIAALNMELIGNIHSYFITAVYGLFAAGEHGTTVLKLVSAGHPPPILHRCNGGIIEYLEVRGKVLGIIPDQEYQAMKIQLIRGDRVFFYTDGLPEMMNDKGEILGFDRLLEVIRRSRCDGLADSLNSIMDDVNRFRCSSPLTDDTVIIGIEIL